MDAYIVNCKPDNWEASNKYSIFGIKEGTGFTPLAKGDLIFFRISGANYGVKALWYFDYAKKITDQKNVHLPGTDYVWILNCKKIVTFKQRFSEDFQTSSKKSSKISELYAGGIQKSVVAIKEPQLKDYILNILKEYREELDSSCNYLGEDINVKEFLKKILAQYGVKEPYIEIEESKEPVLEQKKEIDEPVLQKNKDLQKPVKEQQKKINKSDLERHEDLEEHVPQKKKETKKAELVEQKEINKPVLEQPKDLNQSIPQKKKETEKAELEEQKEINKPVLEEPKDLNQPIPQKNKEIEKSVFEQQKKKSEPVLEQQNDLDKPIQKRKEDLVEDVLEQKADKEEFIVEEPEDKSEPVLEQKEGLIELIPEQQDVSNANIFDQKEVKSQNEDTVKNLKQPQYETVGARINLPILNYAPLNTKGVIFLFGNYLQDLGFSHVEEIKEDFPDAIAVRSIGNGKYRRVRIEFELNSRLFLIHGHEIDECDLIVCWKHDWNNCPIEVIELSSILFKK